MSLHHYFYRFRKALRSTGKCRISALTWQKEAVKLELELLRRCSSFSLCRHAGERVLGLLLVQCCFTSTGTVGLLGTGAQDGHLDFHTAPELWGCCK